MAQIRIPCFPVGIVHPRNAAEAGLPNGKQFVFQATREGKTEIWSLASPGIGDWLFRSAGKPAQITNGQMNSLAPVVSPDGRKLYFIGWRLRGELAKYDLKTRQFLPYLGGIPADFIDFSRDGQWITYVEFPQQTLWRSRIDGTERLQLTFAPIEVMVPQWSPDGQRIVFVGTGAGRKNSIYTITASGGVPEPISQAGGALSPTWSPDGNSLLFGDAPFFETDPGNVAVHRLDLRTRKLETIPGSAGLFSPAGSPDGRYVAAKPLTSRTTLLFDSHTQTWSELAEGWGFTRWWRDGQYLYYMRYGERPAILRIRLSDRKVEEVASLSGFRQGGRLAGLQFALAPDGCPVLLRDTGTQEIYSLNWPSR
jgi:Tol biopolymer transport system component